MKKFLDFLKNNYKQLNTAGLVLAVISIFLIFIFSSSNIGTNVLFIGCVCILAGYYGEYAAQKESAKNQPADDAEN